MIEPLAVGWRAAKVARPAVDEGALVVGAGPIGLAVLLSLKAMGVQRVAVSEVSESRKDLARRLGADLVIDPREQDVVRAVAT
jgi:threonine dehydrogenase-like Zn-dependent dehydrogenase